MAFSDAAARGAQTAANPFGVILSRVREFEARKLKEAETERSEANELKQALLELGKKHEFDVKLKEEESKIKLRERGVPVAQAFKSLGRTTPSENVQPGAAQGVLQASGIRPRGRIVDVDGEQLFIPEDIKEESQRLKVDRQRLESTTEGRKQLATEKAEATAQAQTLAQQKKEAQKTEVVFKQAKNKLKLLFNRFLDATEEGKEGGRVKGFITTIKGKLGINESFNEFRGAMVETSTAIAKIAAPSAKVGPDLIKLFSTTLPSIGFFSTSTPGEAVNQTATSITNAYINYVATHPEEFEDENDIVIEPDFELFRKTLVDMFTESIGKPRGVKTEGEDFSQMSEEQLKAIAGGQ